MSDDLEAFCRAAEDAFRSVGNDASYEEIREFALYLRRVYIAEQFGQGPDPVTLNVIRHAENLCDEPTVDNIMEKLRTVLSNLEHSVIARGPKEDVERLVEDNIMSDHIILEKGVKA